MAYPTPADSVVGPDGRPRRHCPRRRQPPGHRRRGRASATTASATTVWSATFSTEKDVIEAARWIIWEASQELGARSASIHELYMARGRGEIHGFTVPAVNLRTQVFDMAMTMCRAAERDGRRHDRSSSSPGASRSTRSSGPASTSPASSRDASRPAGAARSSSRATTTSSTRPSTRPIRTRRRRPCARLTRDALAVGYGNIDIDSSTLVDLALPDCRRAAAHQLPARRRDLGAHPRSSGRTT